MASPKHGRSRTVSTPSSSFNAKLLLLIGLCVVIVCAVYLYYSSSMLSSFPSVSGLTSLSSSSVASSPCPVRVSTPAPILQSSSPRTNVLITGGAGYIGSHMTLLLFDQKEIYNIVSVDDFSRGDIRNIHRLQKYVPADRKYTFYEMDINNLSGMTQLLKEHEIDIVIHFAGFAYASESVMEPLKYYDNIAYNTGILLKAMSAAGVNRLVYSSSSATYGTILDERCDLPIRETSPQVPVSPYGTSKLHAEHVVHDYAISQHKAGLPFSYAALRYFNVIGADESSRVGALPKPQYSKYGRIVDNCFNSIIFATPMQIYGDDYSTIDGSAVRDYIHVVDLVDAHLKVMNAIHSDQLLKYNVGVGVGNSVLEVIKACETVSGHKVKLKIEPRRPGDPPVVLGDATKLQTEIGWKPRFTDLTESVRTAWKWRTLIENENKNAKQSQQ